MTYSDNIRFEDTFAAKYQGLRIFISHAAMRELYKYGKSSASVVEVLEMGKDAPRKRGAGIIERWLTKKDKTYVAVIARDYHRILKEECWVLIHFGKFGRK